MQPPAYGPAPSDPTPGAAPSAPNPVVEFVRTDRQTASYVLLGLAALLFVLCAVMVYKVTRPAAPVEADTQKKEDTFSLDEAPLKPKDLARDDYIWGGILSGAAFLVAASAALWLLVSVPPTTEARQRADARALILAVGGLLGAILLVAGVWFFYRWSGALSDWLDKGKPKEARWVLYPLLMIVAGGGLMFVSAQPARAEERNNSVMRRLVYGANMGLSVLLLFVVLVVANMFIGLRLPNKLDVTEVGFYSLSEGSKEFLGRLDQPVTAYAILAEGGRTADDIRRLLQVAQDASGGKFQVKLISPVANKSEYRSLAAKYPVLEANETGVLLTVGEDEKRHTFIREDEFTQRDRDPMAPPTADSGRSFVGEARVMRELLFLGENEKRAVVYFTQQAGELALDPPPGGDIGPSASASRLRAYLERNYLEVRPLRFDPAAPKVPDDAAVVVVAEPTSSLSEPHVAAIRQYMNETRGTKKGKLIVLASARFGPKDKVISTGLEALLREFKVALGDRVVMSQETRELDSPELAAVMFAPAAVRNRHPVAAALGEKAIFVAPNWRPVGAAREGNPALRPTPLLITLPGRANWLEEERPRDLDRIINEFRTNPSVQVTKQLTESPRSVGVVVSEGEPGRESGRVAVFGNGLIVSDAMVRQGRGEADPITYELMGGTIDWLRDRPALNIGIESKKYKTVTLPPSADQTRGLWFPLLFALLVVTGFGASVWIVRRRAA
jgi:hypothetical protein